MKTIKLTQVLLLILFSAIILNAQPERKQRMQDELKLTDQQKDKIENLRADHQKRMIDLKANVEKGAADLRSLERKGGFSRNDYLAAVDKITKARNEVAREKANHRMDVYEQLNDDQKKVFSKMPKMGRGREDGMGPRGKHKGGRGMGDGMGMGPGGGGCPCADM